LIGAILINTLLPYVSREFLNRRMLEQSSTGVRVGLSNGGFNYEFGA
jgi:hypothetical protein